MKKINSNKFLAIGILILIIGISFAVGTYAYYQNTLNGTARGTTLGYTCEGNGGTSFVINDIEDIHPGSSEVRNIALTASIYSTATIEVTGYSNMNDSVRPNLALYNDSGHENKMLADGTNAISTEIYPGVPTTIPIYVYWSYGNASENYSDTTASASIKITCSQGIDNRASTLISRATPEYAGAHRYIGPVANNYVYFNGNELWRIIGVYGNNLKIMKATSIGDKLYNASDGNVWAGSTLETYLNKETSGGYYYSLTQTAKDMIVEGTWLAGATAYDATASGAYTSAGATQVTRKVGLIASYEYLYSASGNCHNVAGFPFTGCTSNSWMKLGSSEWTVGPYSGNSKRALIVIFGGYVSYIYVGYSSAVRPAVYLKSDVRIVSGTGESGNPYVLE